MPRRRDAKRLRFAILGFLWPRLGLLLMPGDPVRKEKERKEREKRERKEREKALICLAAVGFGVTLADKAPSLHCSSFVRGEALVSLLRFVRSTLPRALRSIA